MITSPADLAGDPGALDAVAELDSAWFRHFLVEQIGPSAGPGTPPSHPPAT